MKKTYFKKSISLIMAVIMVMSCWVWVAPQKASAVVGEYPVSITFNLEDADAVGGHVLVHYYPLNSAGTAFDTSNPKSYTVIGSLNKAAAKDHVYTDVPVPGMPYMIELKIDDSDWFDETYLELKYFKIGTKEIVSSSIGNYHNAICKFYYDGTFEAINADNNNSIGADDGRVDSVTGEGFTWGIPEPTTVTWSTVTAMTCPKTGTESQSVSVSAKDQYGVELFPPTSWSVTAPYASSASLYADPSSTSSASTTIKLTNAANIAGTTNSQAATITATWDVFGSKYSKTKNFTINDTTYTATFKYKDASGNDMTSTSTAQHGCNPTTPTTYNYSAGDNDYTFAGWNPAATNMIKDTTYNATYSSTFVEADYTEVDNAISAANAIKAQYGTEYELKYTLASRVALDSAINAVVRGKGRTQQDTVDGYADAINNAIAALEPNKFDVIFLDRFGAILLYEKNAEYKTEVTAPTFPEEQKEYHDADNHYTYTGWDSEEYKSVLDDLVISPVYTAEAHDWLIETVTSTCVQAGTQKYTCKVCGYVKYDGGTDLGDHVWASDFTVDLEPTCTLPGSKSIHCTLCDAQKDITAIDPLGHNWSSQSVAVEATCGKIGIMTKVCDDCGVCEHTMIDALEHDYVETVVAPTCTTKGYTEYTCQRAGCGFTYRDNYTDVTSHRFGNWETVYAAACEVEGLEKRVCADCGFMELRETEALTHITPDSWTVITSATCTGTGYQVKNCTLCGLLLASEEVAKLGHNYTVTSETQANCTEAGVKTETCSRCGDVNKTVTQPTGHTYDSGVHTESSCTSIGFTKYTCACGHSYIVFDNGADTTGHDFSGAETITKQATCTEEGYKTVECANEGCTATTTVVIPKLGHKMIAGTAVAATCTTSGYTPYTCDNGCGYTYNVFDADALGHDYVGQVTTEATCTTDGEMIYTCQNDNSHTYKETIPATGHNYVKGTVTDATCTTPATEVYTCACGETYTKYVAVTTAHTWGEWKTVKEATETEPGLKLTSCTVCGAEKTETIEPIGNHVYTSEITTEATCETEGLMTYTCSIHDNCSYTETIPALGHKEKLVYIAATCASTGKAQIVCETCDAELSAAETIPMLAHTYGSGTVTTPATCTEDGVMAYTCTACGTQRSETIEKTGHSLSSKYNAPSCTQAGSIVTTCSKCSYTTTESIPAAGHKLEVTVVDSTCITQGTVTEKCTVCGYEKVTELELKNHKFGGTAISETEATCTTDGEKTFKCETCNEEVTVTTPKLGHSYPDEWTTVSEADCTTDGEKTKTCATCGDVITEVLPKTGHNWGAWVKVDATNDTDGSWTRICQNDPNHVETVVIPKGGHAFENAPEITKPASCTETGTAVYKCSAHENCGVTVEVTLAVIPHTIITEEKAATCTEKGYVKTVCSACGEVFTNEDREIVPHTYDGGTEVPATCTTSGHTVYKCTACTDEIKIYDENEPATGHSLVEGASTATCTNEGLMTLTCEECTYSTAVAVPALGHNYVEATNEATAATCAAPATKTYKCSCGDSYTISVGNKTEDHTWDDTKWQVIESATESSIGYKTNACTVCGQLKVETIEATGEHSFIGGEVIDSKPATCTENGYEIVKCKTHDDCGVETTITLYATGHKENIEYTAADCDTDGSTKIVCGVCGAERDEKTIPALGHLWSEGKVTNATCAEAGKIEYTCTRDNCTATKETTIPRNFTAHDYVTTITEPSCTKAGSIVVKCSRTGCPSNPVKQILPKTEHAWGTPVVTPATCEAEGSEVYTCATCGATKTEVIAKTGHSWGDWEVTTESTNTTEGVLTRECANGCKEEVNFPAGGHNLVEDTDKYVAPTCTQTGTKAYKCSAHENCGISLEVTLDKIQHTFKTTTKAATCEEAGEVITACACGETHKTVIPATGHTLDEGTVTAATCENEGKIVYSCTAKDCTYKKEVVLTKLQHNYIAGTPEAPTCTSSGYTPYKCETCESSYVIITAPANGHRYDEFVLSTATCLTAGTMTLRCDCGVEMLTSVPALGHDYQLDSTTPATCADEATETYKCTRCEAEYTVSVGSKATEHEWNDWKTVEQPSYTSIGYKTRTCKICGKLEVETIQMTGDHNLVEVGRDEPTCDKDGKIYYECNSHTDCDEKDEVVIPKLGHTEELQYQAATCAAAGYAKIYCTTCHTTLKEEAIDKLEHAWGNAAVTLSDCQNTGKVEFTCTYAGCNEAYTVTLPVNPDAHTPKTTVTPASCTQAGSSVTVCEKCDKELVKTELAKLQHNWSNWTVTTEATNSAEGTMTRTCLNSGCNEEETVNFPAGGHKFGNAPDNIEPATCTAKGTATYKCTAHADCGVEITVTLDEIQHTFKTDKKDATCTDTGFIKVYCTADGCTETLVDITTGKLAHEFERIGEEAPTCTSSGYKEYKCKNCDESYKAIGDNAKGHSYEELENSSTATCTTAGTKTLKCSVCGKELQVNVPALGHDWKAGTVTKAPTCKDKGEISFECSRCSDTRTEELPTISHELTTVTKDATCTEDGSVVTTCKYCDYKEEKTIAKKGHTWADAATSTVPAKCEEAGSATYDCVNCDETKTETIPALGHVYVAGNKVEPTCTTSGYTVYTCKNDASHTYNVYDASKPAKGHSFGEWTVVTAATETTEGLKERKCACGETEQEKIPAMMHNMVETDSQDSTCTSNGYITYKCDTKHDGVTCTYTLTVTLPMIAHTLTTDVEAATCEEAGKVVTTCTNCNTVNIESTIPAMGHAWDEGKVTTEASCTAEGEMTFTCQHDASHTYTKPIEKKQHDFVAGTKVEATCTESAYTPYKCKNCAESYEIIEGDALGHEYIIGESTATCEMAGIIKITCSRCSEVIIVDVAALGHKWGTGKVVKQPTCSAEGEIEYTCERCGGKKTDKLPTVEHDYETVTTDATCTADGSVVTTCKNCGDKKTEIIKAKGHTWSDTPESTVPAKCEEKGSATYKCENCGETKTIEIPALGHIYEAKDVIAPTCTTSGYTVYVCKNDADHKYNVYDASKPAVPHDFGEWAVVTNATQETDGLERRECNNCDAYEEKVIPAMKHNMVVVSTKTATCTSEGEIVYKCETKHDGVVCDYTLTVVTSKVAHTLKTVVTDATCDIAGSVVTSCENCDTVNETTIIPALGHKYIGTETKAATCTENGIITYICQNDATHQYTETIPATGHSYKAVLTAPTCTAEGYTTYTCGCGDSYKDDYVPALGHSFGVWTDTGSDDVHTRYCSRCDATETQAHAWDEGEIITAPSFNNDGEMLYTCLICGGTKITGIDADIDENAPTGEIKWNATLWNDFLSVITFGTYVNYDVKLEITAQDKETGINSIEYYVADKALTLDEVKALTSWKEYDSANKLTVSAQDAAKVVVYAKITDKSGNATYISTDGIVFDTVAPVLGIEADKGNAQTNVYCTPVTVVVNDANISHAIYDGKTVALTTDKFYCNEAGAHTLTVFDKAGNSTDISFTINAAHTWTKAPLADDSNLKAAATCEDKAVYYVACSVCGEIGEETFEYGSAAGHNYKGTVTVPATCEEDGVMTYICQNDNSHTYTEIIPASGHTELAATEENRKEATCEENGYYELAVYCGVCGEELDRTSHVIPATGHNYIGSVTKAPTCTQEGVMTYVCANDWKHAYSEEIPALGHTDENNDCTCEVCGEKCCLDSNLYVRVVEPSCTTKGYSVRTCKNCKSETKTEIPALGHKEVVTYVDATCNKYAHKIITCSACDNYYEEIYTDNAYAPHAVVVVPGKPATCVSDGYTEYERCVNCGMVTQAQTLYKEDVPHVDADGNGKCDVCDGKFFTDTKTCNCLCHGTGIKGFLYKIALFFWKLFKMNKSCACGTVHY